MSVASLRGKNFELKVAGIIRHKLKIAVQRDKRSGAGWNKSDISDYWNELPLSLELKDQETIKIQEWFRQADAAASFSKAPTVVFAVDEEILTTLRLSDLLNFLVEIADLQAEVDDLRKPVVIIPADDVYSLSKPQAPVSDVGSVVTKQFERGAGTCREGHIADQFGYCLQSACKYSRGYKPPKIKARR